MTQSSDIVHAFLHALGARDFKTAETLLAKEFTFQGPFDTFRDPKSYLGALQKIYPIVKAVKVQKLFEDGEEACLLYDMETNTPIGTAFICEWFKVQDGKIASIRAVFDARPFAPMFSK